MAISDYTMTGGMSASVTSSKVQVLAPFLEPKFDPADFLNSALPLWSTSGSGNSLAEINTQTQTIVSQLNAQLTRLMSSLTQLTDDILRSGGRLAYEVEMLRGDTTSLADVLVDGLRDEIEKFLPQGVNLKADAEKHVTNGTAEEENSTTSMPDYIVKLNTLAIVRDRLDNVIKVFGSAMDWHLPPSEAASSILGMPSAADNQELERIGKEYMQKQRAEIADLVDAGAHDIDRDAYNAALQRVEDLRRLAVVWKGTAEEKARSRFVDELESIIDAKRLPTRGYQMP